MTKTAPPASAEFLQDLHAFIQQKGFIWGPSPELYGGLSGFYDYAPLGKLLKNNVEQKIRETFRVNNFWEVECPTVVPTKVWEASGHLGGFSDPLIEAEDGSIFRVDKLLEELFPGKVIKPKEYLKIIEENNITAPNGSPFKKEIRNHSLMMKTTVGLNLEAYNRPETATTTYLPFLRFFEYFRKKLPFGVFQIGKAYRNEISPRQSVLRMREFTQAEGQLFIFKDQKQQFGKFETIKDVKLPLWSADAQNKEEDYVEISLEEAMKIGLFKNQAYAYTVWLSYKLFTNAGIPSENIRLRQHTKDEIAFYADDAWDIEVLLNSFGWIEMCGVHDRTSYDLEQHAKHSGRDLGVSDESHKKEIPHVLEIAFGVDRIAFALLDIFYNPQDVKQGKTTFHIPAMLAPIKVGVFPLMKKDGLPELAHEIYSDLSTQFTCSFDTSGSVGRRYLRASEDGTPYCITIDYQTKEDGTITLRDRDTEEQVRVHKDKLAPTVRALLNRKLEFREAGDPVQKEEKK